MKEAVNEEHEGKRKNELTWKINRIHWEKNRFIYDLMFVRKVRRSPHVGSHAGRGCQAQPMLALYGARSSCTEC